MCIDPLSAVSMTTHQCENMGVSPDIPVSGVVVCSANPPLTNLTHHTFLHGDTYVITLQTPSQIILTPTLHPL